MQSELLTQHAALAAQLAALPADFVGYGLILEAMLHKLEPYDAPSREFDLRWYIDHAMDVVHSEEEAA